jgi:hypothetical protein
MAQVARTILLGVSVRAWVVKLHGITKYRFYTKDSCIKKTTTKDWELYNKWTVHTYIHTRPSDFRWRFSSTNIIYLEKI